MTENEIAKVIVDAAFKIHTTLGPGLLESVYEVVLARELEKRGLVVERQKPVKIVFDGMIFDEGYRIDLLVNDLVVVEIKSVETMAPVHKKTIAHLSATGQQAAWSLDQFWRAFDQGWHRPRCERLERRGLTWRLCVFA